MLMKHNIQIPPKRAILLSSRSLCLFVCLFGGAGYIPAGPEAVSGIGDAAGTRGHVATGVICNVTRDGNQRWRAPHPGGGGALLTRGAVARSSPGAPQVQYCNQVYTFSKVSKVYL